MKLERGTTVLELLNRATQLQRKKSIADDYQAKVFNLLMKNMTYYSPSSFDDFWEWLEQNMNLELYKDLKMLYVGSCPGHIWIQRPRVSQLNIEIIDQSLLNVKFAQQRMLANNFLVPIHHMCDTQLKYESHTFDCVFSRIAFQVQTIDEQMKSLNEAQRVLRPKGIHYILVNESGPLDTLYQLMREFDDTIQIINNYEATIIDTHYCLNKLYEEVELKDYEASHLIHDAKQCMTLFLTYEDSNFIEYVVKRHLGKRFNEFLQNKIQTQGSINLKRKYRLFKCENKKKQLGQF